MIIGARPFAHVGVVGIAATLLASDSPTLVFFEMQTLLLALHVSLAQGTGGLPTPVPTDSAIRARVDSATRAFQTQWRYAWQETQREQPSLSGVYVKDADMRSLSLHCHWVATSLRIRDRVVRGAVRAHAMCPIWYRLDGPRIDDERHGIDLGLTRSRRRAIQPLRQALRSLLDSAALHLPGDVHVTGQRVRFALDAGDFIGARSAATACNGDRAQCELLRGMVMYYLGEIAGADSAFTTAASLMGDDERCAWNDVGVLLEAEEQRDYAAIACAARVDMERRLWWLSDPLYLEPGNERHAEHFARKVQNTLLSPLGFDGRLHWEPKQGGEAVAETLVRYGWPYQMYWGGPDADRGHDEWLIKNGADTAPPYVAMEYARDRLHTVPRLSAIRSPFHAQPDDWQLNAPAGDDDWWPREHYSRDRSAIAQLPVGQSVMLRRRSSTRFVWAADLDAAELARPRGDSVQAFLFQSRAVANVASVGAFPGRVGNPLIIDAPLREGEALLSIELNGDRAHPAARTRFGATIPATLADFADGMALSQPLLFDPTADINSSLDADAAVRRMHGTTTFRKPRRIGVYWEAYGFDAADTVEIEVQMAREDRAGIFARVAGVFRLGPGNAESLGIRWREAPGSSRAMQHREGNVPVQMRSIVLDVSRLSRGTYRLQLSVSRAGVSAISAARRLEIR